MRTTPPAYKYSSLIAGFGLAALVIGVVLLVATTTLQLASWIILALGASLLITALIIDFRRVRGAVTGRRGRFSTGNTVMAFVFIGVILLVNAISVQYNARFDITELSQFTLTSQTKEVLRDMETPVTALCFFTPNDQYGIGTYAQSLLDEYENYTELLTVKVIDPDEHPDEARQYSITQYQIIVFESDIGVRSVPPEDIIYQAENSFTSAILEVTGVVQKTIYFLTGHGEASIDGEYAYANQALLDNLFRVKPLDLMATQGIPEDCSALVIAGPQNAFTALEDQLISTYLDNNGKVLLMINPGAPDDIKAIISDWWVDVEEGTVIDPSAYVSPNMDTPLIPRTRNEFGLSETYYPGAVALTPQEDYPDDILIAALFYTSGLSWVEKNYDPSEEPVFNESIETLGSRALGVLITINPPDEETQDESAQYTQFIVVGDSDFASNQNFYNADNAYQFLYLVNYLTSGEQLVSIERKVLPYRSLVVTPEEESFIRVASIGLLPFLVLVAGGVIWWRRR
jgi:ABC-2 type transport system permease protein